MSTDIVTIVPAVLAPVSVVVLTFNEARNIRRCLASVSGWAREIHVVDSGSTDETLEIARAYTDLIHHHAYVDHRSQWAWVFLHLPLVSDWLLLLDADNIVTPELRASISRVLIAPDVDVDGYYSEHIHIFRGQRIHGLKGSWLRLVRHRNTSIDSSELVDFRLIPRGRTAQLVGAIVESNANEDDMDFWIDKHQRFASRMAVEEILRRNARNQWQFRPRLFGNPDERITWFKNRWYGLPLYVRPLLYFVYRYIFRLGFRDGRVGLVYHFMQALWFRLLVDVKMVELQQQIGSGAITLEELQSRFMAKDSS